MAEQWRPSLDGPPRSFELDGEVYELVGSWSVLLDVLTLVDWQLELLYALVDPEDLDVLDDRLDDDDDPLELDDVDRVAEQLVEAATGRRWWVAQKLYGHVAAAWSELEGRWALRGLDLVAMLDRPAYLCNVVHAYLAEGAGDGERRIFEAKLDRPPGGVDVVETPPVSDEEAAAAFMAAVAATKGGRVSTAVA
ncbi:hypothetical protein [Nonomuraea sp. NEAU-A123]|uniref:hypothetical protein n=1 Tax=Nonomuraea sp. NEAU-A123 TaxID=2839649 RepID=UPI001BE3E784|nr:hypothetical protein [Nonomuraea sp. NEAU-A123]MBT2226244.1 hypothetical protein [Nonomuraea sp. NEAU-A123]